MKELIGIDIGSFAAKLVYKKGKSVKTVLAPLPENLFSDGRIQMVSTMKEFLKSTRKKNGFPKGKSTAVLGGGGIFCQRITMPVISHEQLLLNLSYEFRDYVGTQAAEYYYDYALKQVTENEETGEKTLDLICACAERKTVRDYQDALDDTGLTLSCVIPREMAYDYLLRKKCVTEEEKNKSRCIIDIGHYSTNVHFYKGDILIATRVIDLAGHDIDVALSDALNVDIYVANTYKTNNYQNCLEGEVVTSFANRLAVEIMKSVNFYYFNNQGSQIDSLIFIGGTSHIPQVTQAIARMVNIEEESYRSLLPAEVQAHAPGPESIVAFGAALGGGQK